MAGTGPTGPHTPVGAVMTLPFLLEQGEENK